MQVAQNICFLPMSHAGPLTIWLKRVLWCPSKSYPWSIRACCSLVLPTCAKHSSQHYLHSQYELVYNPVYRLHSEQFDRLCPQQCRLWALFDEIVWAKAWTQTFLLHYCVHRFLCKKTKVRQTYQRKHDETRVTGISIVSFGQELRTDEKELR